MATTMRYKQRNSGFTLLEIMIVVTIIAILSAVGWSLYATQERKSRRSDATLALTNARQALIASRSDNGAYPATTVLADAELTAYKPTVADTPPANCKANRGYQQGNLQSCQGYYQIATIAADADTFTLQATPLFLPPPAIDCDTLTLNQLGAKGSTTSTGTPNARCWAE